MNIQTELRKDINRKEKEAKDLQSQIDNLQSQISDLLTQEREIKAYISAHERTLKLLPDDALSESVPQKTLRFGSDAANARDYLLKVGKPLHVSEILKGIEKENDKKNRVSLSGALAHYAKDDQIFIKTAPRTFGLIDLFKRTSVDALQGKKHADDLPDDFGEDSTHDGLEAEEEEDNNE